MTEDAIAALRDDAHLGPLVEEYGPMTIEPAEDFFQRFVTSIIKGVGQWTANTYLPSRATGVNPTSYRKNH